MSHEIGRALSARTSVAQLMTWRLRLYCDHVVKRVAHNTPRSVRGAYTGALFCAECGLDPATIVDAEAIDLLHDGA